MAGAWAMTIAASDQTAASRSNSTVPINFRIRIVMSSVPRAFESLLKMLRQN